VAVEQVDTVVIGGGVVGLACAHALAARGAQVWLLERERVVGSGVSARNSEVLHAGIYYAKDSNKARWCVQGRAALLAFCETYGVPYRLCGKLIVATEQAQRPALQTLAARALANGVTLQWLEGEQARALEPALSCVAALHSPNTGIVDSHALMLALCGALEANTGTVVLGTEVLGGRRHASGWVLQVRTDDGDMELLAKRVVNAAATGDASAAGVFCARPLLYGERLGAFFPIDLPGPPRRLAGHPPHAGFGGASALWPRSAVAARYQPRDAEVRRGPRFRPDV
jgi:L-2-hydroxyglutarate oxidase LhgO